LSPAKQQQLAQEVTGFWAFDVWQMSQIPVPHNELCKHSQQKYLRFVTHSASVNLELKYALKQSFLSRKWVPWNSDIATGLKCFTPFFNETLDKQIDTLFVHCETQWTQPFRDWLQNHHPKNRCALGFLRLIYRTLEDFYDQRDEWEKDRIDLRKVGLPVSKNTRHWLDITRISPLWLRDLIRQYLKKRVNASASSLSAQLQNFTYFSAFLQKKGKAEFASLINRELIVQFNTYLKSIRLQQNSQSQAIGAPLSRKTRARILGDLRALFDFCRTHQLAAFPQWLIFDEDIPKAPRLSDARYIPDFVVLQLLAHQGQLAQPFQTMLQVILEIGCRPSELCELAIDCLTWDQQGEPYVTRYARKQYKTIRVPISQEMDRVIKAAQQWAKQHYGESVKYLFPKNQDEPYHRETFNQKVNHYIAQHQITDENGQLWHFTAKQCRHTVGTRLINEGVSQPTVQRFLGHSSPQMTAVYAHLHDKTLKEAFFNSNGQACETIVTKGNQRVSGQVVNGAGELVDSFWLKHQFQTQALPNGFCVRPLETGECQSGQACLHCTHLRTTVEHLPILEEQLHLGEQIEEQAAAQGFERQYQVNAKNNQALRKLINVLKQIGGGDA